MDRVLILYPKELLAYSKFQRKVEMALSELDQVSLLYIHDHNNFIEKYASEIGQTESAVPISSSADSDITHAIIFDDGEEFTEEYGQLKFLGVPVRRLKIDITRVVNIKRDTKYQGLKSTPEYEYIGRGSYWGNPYSMFESNDDGFMDDRDEVIRKYEYDFKFDLFPNKDKKQILKLTGKRLGCFCKPEACHGDILAEFLNSYDEEYGEQGKL